MNFLSSIFSKIKSFGGSAKNTLSNLGSKLSGGLSNLKQKFSSGLGNIKERFMGKSNKVYPEAIYGEDIPRESFAPNPIYSYIRPDEPQKGAITFDEFRELGKKHALANRRKGTMEYTEDF